MRAKFLVAATASVLVLAMIGGCAKATTITIPATTITLPAVTTTLPAMTVTLPGKVTTISATTVTIPATVTTVPPATLEPPPVSPSGFLPTTPINITSHMAAVVDDLKGECLRCHGIGTSYFEFPTYPSWDGTIHGSMTNLGIYYVAQGSIQDHTGRTNDMCLTCHLVVQ